MAAAKLCEQQEPEFASTGLDTRDCGQSSSTEMLNQRDTEATSGVQVIDEQPERQPPAQGIRQYRGHSIPATSDPHAADYGTGLSEAMSLNSSEPLPEAQRTNASGFVENDQSESDAKPCTEASQSDGGLPSLPLEIQLQILEACVVRRGTHIELIDCRNFQKLCDHNGIDLAILLTCRLYREEGSKMYQERNNFTVRTVRPFITLLDHYSRLLPDIKHLTLLYTKAEWSIDQHFRDVRYVRAFMPRLESLNCTIESCRD